jgi:hypothetical protein
VCFVLTKEIEERRGRNGEKTLRIFKRKLEISTQAFHFDLIRSTSSVKQGKVVRMYLRRNC